MFRKFAGMFCFLLIFVMVLAVEPFNSPALAQERLKITIEQFILNQGNIWANVNIQDKDGNTALHLVVKEGHLPALFNLLAAGADFNTENDKGESAYDLAIKKSQPTTRFPPLQLPISTYGMSDLEYNIIKLENKIENLEYENRLLRDEITKQKGEMILVLMAMFGK